MKAITRLWQSPLSVSAAVLFWGWGTLHADEFAVDLPPGLQAVWESASAYHETTPTRERICLNGLWRWQPADAGAQQVPSDRWGYFKVPGCWPGITDYMQKDSQTLYAHPAWSAAQLSGITAAWYEREMTIPRSWGSRRITLHIESLNSYAVVFVDGVRVGEMQFPGGDVELTTACPPGSIHRLSLLLVALPLKGVMLSYTDSASARTVKGSVARRGLCGDVYLVSTPSGARVAGELVETSIRQQTIKLTASVSGLEPGRQYRIQAQISRAGTTVKAFASEAFAATDLVRGRITTTASWLPDQLWDLHTPQNVFELQVSLWDAAGRMLDAHWSRRFGFREFWINGRDFYLNGSRIFLSAVPLDNAQVGAALATYEATRETLARLKSFGINYVYTHNYGCEPGAHLGFSEILRAADDAGILVGFTQPHFSHYEWKTADADASNGYARHAEYYAGVASEHPSVVMYVMSHNATGYEEDMNPDLIDGLRAPRDRWGSNNVNLAMRAEALVAAVDPSRIVYHHASGNLGVMHDSNFYPNFTPIQELDDWFEHWATTGVKPAFTCEYGAPFSWDWTMYRGWYQGQREWGSARVPWEFCLAEWNAQFFGDRAYQVSEAERQNLRWEARQFRAGSVWHRWDYPNPVGSDRFDERYPIFARYLQDNWRAYRAWGVSGISPWEYGHFWKLRDGVDRRRKSLPVDWEHLQRPGFSPDFIDQRYERMDLAFERSDWVATPAAEALLRNNRPVLAYIAGKPESFTSKDHNFLPGETVRKQIVVINNSREVASCRLHWSLNLPQTVAGEREITVPTGQQVRTPIEFHLPPGLPPDHHELRLTASFGDGSIQEDRFTVNVLPEVKSHARLLPVDSLALFDPRGETKELLEAMGIHAEIVSADTDLAPYSLLVIGKATLTVGGPAPDLLRVRDGLKVIMFEQSADALEQRLGFRVQQYGLRELFSRVPDHPVLNGIVADNLHDWRGVATLLSPRLDYELRPLYGPTVTWAGLTATRVWRCGNRGNVASVIIEKPVRGDFLPILDGGFSLQYGSLLEYREGQGMVLLCQLDVTGRTERDPAAEALVRNLFDYVAKWKPPVRRRLVYAGDSAGNTLLSALGIAARPFNDAATKNEVLLLAPGAGQLLANHHAAVRQFVSSGGHVVALGMEQEEAEALFPFRVTMKRAEHIASY